MRTDILLNNNFLSIFMKDKREILFYCASTPTIMIYKIAKILKKNRYSPILFTMCEKDLFDYKFYKGAFNKIICSNFQFSKENLKSIPYFLERIFSLLKFIIQLKSSKPYVMIGTLGGNWQLKLVHKYFLKKYPFIYFPYDIISHFFYSREEALKTTKSFEIEAERYCFENCDGILHKGAPEELYPLKGRIFKNLNLTNLNLNFLPYCSKEFIVSNKHKLSQKDKALHFVYIGGFPNEPIFLEKLHFFIKKTILQKIHLHFYTLIDHIKRKNEKDYISQLYFPFYNNSYFHLHQSLGPKEIISEISKYDYGFFLSYKRNLGDIERAFTLGNKVSSFFEAGLPIVYDSSFTFIDKLLSSYGLGISFNDKNIMHLKKHLKKLNYTSLVKRVEKARKDFDIEKNFPRLESFIEAVIAKKKNK